MNDDKTQPKKKPLKKITQERLKNIALYYLQRFESSSHNLRQVLQKRIYRYAKQNPDFNKNEAFEWVENLLSDFERLGYIDDKRYAALKIKDYLCAGKSERYIKQKLKAKGIDIKTSDMLLSEQEYDKKEAALKFALKKHIGPYRKSLQERIEFKKKDMAALLRAGFDYDDVCDILNITGDDI